MSHLVIPDLAPSTYQRSELHSESRIWPETNCYVDVLIEVIHAMGFNPVDAMAFTFAIDFEYDQWTFFRFPQIDLLEIFGFDIQELNPWQDTLTQVANQVAQGHLVLVEVDSFFLPDTAGTAYQREHVKSTIAVNQIDPAAQRMGYFHGKGYYELESENFQSLFGLNNNLSDAYLPPYIEFIRSGRGGPKDAKTVHSNLLMASLSRQINLLPVSNPFERFKQTLVSRLGTLANNDLEEFHRFSFANTRQFGACFELAWTFATRSQQSPADLASICPHLKFITEEAKRLQMQMARSVVRKKPLDLQGIDQMAESWNQIKHHLQGLICR